MNLVLNTTTPALFLECVSLSNLFEHRHARFGTAALLSSNLDATHENTGFSLLVDHLFLVLCSPLVYEGVAHFEVRELIVGVFSTAHPWHL